MQGSVEAWLASLELKEYAAIFHSEGYKSSEDMENLKELTIDQLKAMGIKKTGRKANSTWFSSTLFFLTYQCLHTS